MTSAVSVTASEATQPRSPTAAQPTPNNETHWAPTVIASEAKQSRGSAVGSRPIWQRLFR
jgi:hypothetical protein